MCGSLVLPLLAAALGASPAADFEIVPLASEARVREVCAGLQPVERQVFGGNAAARGQAKAAFEKEQERLQKTSFSLELGWAGFSVGEWDESEKVVRLTTERPFRAYAGALTLFDAGRDDIELEAVEGEVEALKAGLAKGTLSLLLLFKPAEEEGTACVISKAKTYAFAVDLLGAELRAGDKALARSTRDDLQPIPSAQGKPSVEVRPAAGLECPECSSEIVEAAIRQVPQLTRCYEAALVRKPVLDGSLVLAVGAGKAGELTVATVIADSVDDAELLACTKAALGKTKVEAKGSKAQVLVEYGRK
ncbi:MAG: hypothetical protein HY901_14550 [Deltaproteobacteria bacterium]|nr:hypothetical protein [Deltaproteobacteria bacterium]